MKKTICIVCMLVSAFASAQEIISYTKEGKMGLIESKGNKIIAPAIYDKINAFDRNGNAHVSIGEKNGIVNRKGLVLVPVSYQEVVYAKEAKSGFQWKVKRNDLYGIVNERGLETITPQYLELQNGFSEGLAYAKLASGWGFIDSLNKTVIPFSYEDIDRSGFLSGLMPVKKDGKWGVINKKGIAVVPFEYDKAVVLSPSDALILVWHDAKGGFFSYAGKKLCEPQFESVEYGFSGKKLSWAVHNTVLVMPDKLKSNYFKE